jgi:4,5-DOPA dioxygenase extradiol
VSAATRMPVLFVGHGSPMNVIEDNAWSRGFAALRAYCPEPRAILAVSAHWYVDGSFVTGDEAPQTIHDFSGFPQPLYEIQYAAPGDPALAARVCELLGPDRVRVSLDWGLDHGAWSVLRWMYPDAQVPVVQLSLDRRLSAPAHLEIGRELATLRDEGVLILASGNVTHNLRAAFAQMRSGSSETPEWARQFDAATAEAVAAHDADALLALWPDGDTAARAHPTPDHWLPLLYAHGASAPEDSVQFPMQGFDLGSLSMRSIVYG